MGRLRRASARVTWDEQPVIHSPPGTKPFSSPDAPLVSTMPTFRAMDTAQSEIWRDVVKQENKNADMWDRNYGPNEDRFRPDTGRPATGASKASSRPATGASNASWAQSAKSEKKESRAEKKAKLLAMKATVMASLNDVETALTAERKAKGSF